MVDQYSKNMKNNITRLLVLFLVFGTHSIFAQEKVEQVFKNDIDAIIKDAATGFQKSKGAFSDKQWIYVYNHSNLSIFNATADAFIGYHEATYLKYSKENLPEENFFFQKINSKTSNGAFVYENAERIFDELATNLKLKKKFEKQEKRDKGKKESIVYLENKRKVFQLIFDFEQKSVVVYIHSDLRPADVPQYLGCLVLYNIQSNSFVSANTYYVYGKTLDSPDALYGRILSDKDDSFKRLFSKYEWIPGATTYQVDQKMTALGIKEYGQKVNPEGFGIK